MIGEYPIPFSPLSVTPDHHHDIEELETLESLLKQTCIISRSLHRLDWLGWYRHFGFLARGTSLSRSLALDAVLDDPRMLLNLDEGNPLFWIQNQ